VTKSLAAKRW